MKKIIVNSALFIVPLIGAFFALLLSGITFIFTSIIQDNDEWNINEEETWYITSKLLDFIESVFK